MPEQSINSLEDLNMLRSAPELTIAQESKLLEELKVVMSKFEWFTVGIMAKSLDEAIKTIRLLEKKLNWNPMKIIESPNNQGPIFLKANQNNGEIHMRIEHGLGEGVLITGHSKDLNQTGATWGPLPLRIFSS